MICGELSMRGGCGYRNVAISPVRTKPIPVHAPTAAQRSLPALIWFPSYWIYQNCTGAGSSDSARWALIHGPHSVPTKVATAAKTTASRRPERKAAWLADVTAWAHWG